MDRPMTVKEAAERNLLRLIAQQVRPAPPPPPERPQPKRP